MSDEKLKAAYSALPREEPGAAVDGAILAASRRALARPSVSRRWAGPVSIAAVLVLAFGVTLHMQEEKSPTESADMYVPPPPAVVPQASRAVVPESPTPRADERAAEPMLAQKQKKVAPLPAAKPDRNEARAFQERERDKDRSLHDQAVAQSERKEPQPKLQAAPAEELLAKEANVRQAPAVTARDTATAVATSPPPAAAAPSPLGAAAEAPARAAAAPAAPAAQAAPDAARMKREAFASKAITGLRAADAQAPDEPTRELEAIAKLRVEGRHEEADKALAEFRRKRPDYRIPDAMWERVKPR